MLMSKATSPAPSPGHGSDNSRIKFAAMSFRATSSNGLLAHSGISPDTTVVLYGDNNNWFAAWAFWQLKIYGHKDVRLLNGGRKKWLHEGREICD